MGIMEECGVSAATVSQALSSQPQYITLLASIELHDSILQCFGCTVPN